MAKSKLTGECPKNPAGFHGAVKSTRVEDDGIGYMCQFCQAPLYRDWKTTVTPSISTSVKR